MGHRIIAFGLILMTGLCGCANMSADMHEKIHSRFFNVPSYSAQCEMTVISNKTENKYEFVCTYDSIGNRYRIDYPDMTVILSEDYARVIRSGSVVNVPSEEGNMLMFVNTFFESYYDGEKASLSVGGTPSGGYTELEAELKHPTRFGHKMRLWIDNKKIVPHIMRVYDREDRETLSVAFSDFEFVKNEKNIEEKFD